MVVPVYTNNRAEQPKYCVVVAKNTIFFGVKDTSIFNAIVKEKNCNSS